VIVTGPNLEPRIEGPVLVIHQSDELARQDGRLEQGHAWPQRPDRQGQGLHVTEAEAEQQILAFLSAKYVPKGVAPMCGNTIGQDRRFLVKYMPKLEAFFHYRNLDVSTLKELAKRWRPEVYSASKSSRRTRRWPTCTSRSTSWCTTARTS
jgi:oligoribonuclease